jgi:hypothetical protein
MPELVPANQIAGSMACLAPGQAMRGEFFACLRVDITFLREEVFRSRPVGRHEGDRRLAVHRRHGIRKLPLRYGPLCLIENRERQGHPHAQLPLRESHFGDDETLHLACAFFVSGRVISRHDPVEARQFQCLYALESSGLELGARRAGR